MLHVLMVRLILNSLALPFLFLGILGIKKFLGPHLTKRIQYNLWFLFLFSLAVPFLPYFLICTKAGTELLHMFSSLLTQTPAVSPTAAHAASVSRSNLFADFSVSVSLAFFSMDLVFLKSDLHRSAFQSLLEAVRSRAFKNSLLPFSSYHTQDTGHCTLVNG